MATKYLHCNFVIDYETLSKDVRVWRRKEGLTQAELDDFIGASGVISAVELNAYDKYGMHLLMKNFLAIVNLMDEDPRKYFLLDASLGGES